MQKDEFNLLDLPLGIRKTKTLSEVEETLKELSAVLGNEELETADRVVQLRDYLSQLHSYLKEDPTFPYVLSDQAYATYIKSLETLSDSFLAQAMPTKRTTAKAKKQAKIKAVMDLLK